MAPSVYTAYISLNKTCLSPAERSGLLHLPYNWAPKKRQNEFNWTSRRLCHFILSTSYNSLFLWKVSTKLEHIDQKHVSTKFEANPLKTWLQWPKNAKMTLWRRDLVTSLLFFSHDSMRLYTVSMTLLSLKQIGWKTWLQWPKNAKINVITSQRRYIMTFLHMIQCTYIMPPCIHQIWSNSVKKHGHYRKNLLQSPPIASRHQS